MYKDTLYSKRNIIEWEKNIEIPPKLSGKKIIDNKGYVKIYAPEHTSNRRGFMYEHRLVMSLYLGRKLEPWETIHHINELKVDNRIGNLFLTTNSEHTVLHREGKNLSLHRRTHMRNKTRKRRRAYEVRKRNAAGRFI